jgi:uncharacterized protein YacL
VQNGDKSILAEAERSFFTLRYAVPGFTFILISVLASYPTLKEILFVNANVTLVGTFLAFFSLLGGGAVGFLVSQLWYVIDLSCFYGNYGKLRQLRKDLKKEYNLKDDRFDQVLFFNQMFYRFSDERTQYYSHRRYDLRHTCGSTLVATLLGYVFGLLIRVHMFSTHMTLEQVSNSLIGNLVQFLSNMIAHMTLEQIGDSLMGNPLQLLWNTILGAQTYDLLVFLIFMLLSIVLAIGLCRVSLEHSRVIDKEVRKIMRVHQDRSLR